MSSVLRCQLHYESDDHDAIITSRTALYSHNPHIFFGVGLPIVRYAIETQSESLAMMIPSYFFSSFPLCETLPQYQPRYHLPTMVGSPLFFFHLIFRRINSEKLWGEECSIGISLVRIFTEAREPRDTFARRDLLQKEKFETWLKQLMTVEVINLVSGDQTSATKMMMRMRIWGRSQGRWPPLLLSFSDMLRLQIGSEVSGPLGRLFDQSIQQTPREAVCSLSSSALAHLMTG